MSTTTLKVYRDLSAVSGEWADKTRTLAGQHGITILNLIGSPGSGKTSLLESMVAGLRSRLRFAVLEGDVATTRDAERLDALGVPVSQLITEGGCHLSARLVHSAFKDLRLAELDVVIIENVGNLVCPASFDIGESAKVAVLSVTEGEEKPVKYPRLFREASAVVLTKTDLLPYLPLDVDQCLENIRRTNGTIPVFQVSAVEGTGVEDWIGWVSSFARDPAKPA